MSVECKRSKDFADTVERFFLCQSYIKQEEGLSEGAFVIGASVWGHLSRGAFVLSSPYILRGAVAARDDCALVAVMPCQISHLTAKREGSGANGVTINSEPSARSNVNTSKQVRHIASRRLAIMQVDKGLEDAA